MEATGGLETAVVCSFQTGDFDFVVVNPGQAVILPIQWDNWVASQNVKSAHLSGERGLPVCVIC